MVGRREIFLLVIALGGTPDVFADKVLLKTGKTIEGQILRQDAKMIVVDAGIGTPVTFYRDEISDIISAPLADPANLADKIENEAVMLIDAGKRQEGLNKMVKAIAIDPSPLRQMNYGSVLFGDGVEMYKNGDVKAALAVLRVCEKQLKSAIEGFDQDHDSAYLSQCYFLLGEMYAHAFHDKQIAKDFYIKSVNFFDHPAAKAALEKLAGET